MIAFGRLWVSLIPPRLRAMPLWLKWRGPPPAGLPPVYLFPSLNLCFVSLCFETVCFVWGVWVDGVG